MNVGAPGKLFLAGEYGVLDGGTAVVTAVDRRVVARLADAGLAPAPTPVVAEVLSAVRAHCQARGVAMPAGTPVIDSASLSEDGRKLGLGSSAAVAAAATGALLAAAGLPVEDDPETVFALADAAHRASQGGRGSGADVAAAVLGGVIAFARTGGTATFRRLEARPAFEPVVISAGSPSVTVDHVRAVERLAARDPRTHARRLQEIRDAALAFLRAHEGADGAALVTAVAAAHAALEALGHDADLPIVTPPLAAAAALAREIGGAAKPSGAGGGDVGVAFFADPDAARGFRRRAAALELRILDIKTGARGLARGDVASGEDGLCPASPIAGGSEPVRGF